MFLKKLKNKLKKAKFKTIIISFVLTLIIVIVITFFQFYTYGKINSGINVAGIDLSLKTRPQAFEILSNINSPESITLIKNSKKYEIKLSDISFSYDLQRSVDKAYLSTRTGNFFYDTFKKINLLFKKEDLGLEINIDEKSLEQKLSFLAKELEVKPLKPKLILKKDTVEVEKGTKGSTIDFLKLRSDIGVTLSFIKKDEIEIPLEDTGYVLNEVEILNSKERATKLVNKNLTLIFNDSQLNFDDEKLIEFINPIGEYYEENIIKEIEIISAQIDKKPQDSIFVFENGKVKEFTPSSDGYKLQKDILKNMIIGNLRTLETSDTAKLELDVPVEITKPKIQNKDVNNLGIEVLLGRGSSKFVGSITNRIFNIKLASSKFVGIIVAPGENFSFNKTLGDVSQETGYKQAYIIKEGKTILGDGGGVCQVSTTLFRAALNAGLPIIERQAHAYRVGYYEQDSPPGLDATVYSPHPDLIFKNDTPNHILIQSIYNEKSKTLIFEIYGTFDGRISNVTKPIITSSTAPGEDIYQDDPTLPIGTIRQIEHKAWGAKVKFDYEVRKDNETIFKKTYYSNYQPWQAVYLRGTMPTN